MDYKEKVEWLGRYQASVSCQHMLEEEIEVLRSDAERVTACMSGMPGRSGPNADRLPRAVERIEEAQKRLEQQLESCMETRAEIMCGIMTVRRTSCTGRLWRGWPCRGGREKDFSKFPEDFAEFHCISQPTVVI